MPNDRYWGVGFAYFVAALILENKKCKFVRLYSLRCRRRRRGRFNPSTRNAQRVTRNTHPATRTAQPVTRTPQPAARNTIFPHSAFRIPISPHSSDCSLRKATGFWRKMALEGNKPTVSTSVRVPSIITRLLSIKGAYEISSIIEQMIQLPI